MFKDKKTTYVAIAAGFGFIASVLLVFVGKATLVEAGGYLGVFSAFLITILGILSKDSKKTEKSSSLPDGIPVRSIDRILISTLHTQYVVIPGRGIKEPPPEYEDSVVGVEVFVTLENGEEHTLSI